MMPLDDMYREIILDHYRSPRGKKPLENASVSAKGHNPACGDELDMSLEIKDNVLKGVHVNCKGCAISTASSSMLAETVEGRPFDEVVKIAEVVRKMLKGETEEPDDEDLGDLSALSGVRQFPVRIKCALLAWVTLIESLEKYRRGQADEGVTVSTEEPADGSDSAAHK